MSNSRESENRLLEVGFVGKPHGLSGQLHVTLVSNLIAERTQVGSIFFIGSRELVLKSAKPQSNKWLMTFEGVSSRTEAEKLVGKSLLAEALQDSNAAFIHELIGCSLVDQHGTNHGEITAVIDNPAADLLELKDGQLVPMNFYESHNETTVSVSVPPGLLG